jgi:hypothetical protein
MKLVLLTHYLKSTGLTGNVIHSNGQTVYDKFVIFIPFTTFAPRA